MKACSSNIQGWWLRGQYVPPLEAYTNDQYWLDSFLHQFPDIKEKIERRDKELGRTKVVFYRIWVPVIVAALDKMREKNEHSR